MAPAGLRRPRDGARGRRLGARAREREREGRAGRQARGVHRQLAGEGAQRRARQDEADLNSHSYAVEFNLTV